MRDMKYIMVIDEFGNETPVIFPSNLIHQEVAHGVRRACKCVDVVSAGFVKIEELKGADFILRKHGKMKHQFVAYGESESLGLKSDKNDSELINFTFYGPKIR